MTAMAEELRDAGHTLTEKDEIRQLKLALPSQFEVTVLKFETLEPWDRTIESLQNLLCNKYDAIMRENTEKSRNHQNYGSYQNFSRNNFGRNNFGNFRGNGNFGNANRGNYGNFRGGPRGGGYQNRFGDSGHANSNFQQNNSGQNNFGSNQYSQNNQSSQNGQNQNQKRDFSQVTCHCCSGKGHFASICPSKNWHNTR